VGILFILPLFVSLHYIRSGRRDKAFLNVYLPCLLLLPTYYAYRVPHLPPISVSAWALLPLGVSLLTNPPGRPSYRRMDLWIILFMLSFAASEALKEYSPKDGLVLFASGGLQMFFAYVVGRRLIEPRLRLETMKRIVLLFLCLTPAIVLEAGAAWNLWIRIGERLFGIRAWFVQLRGGHARVAACYGDAILAGMLFEIGFLMNCSLAQLYKRDKTRLGPLLSKLERYQVPAILLIVFIFLTQSRGPMACTALGFLIMQIPKFKNVKVAGIVIFLILAGAGIGVSKYLDNYTNVTVTATMTEEQASAVYRKQLLKNYEPIIEAGGWLGWGILSRPQTSGQDSIDNHYMLLQLSQGKLGVYLFVLMAAESVFSAARCAFTFRSLESRLCAFSLLASLVGLFVSLYTVYLGEQVVQVCFLLLGWSQSLQDVGDEGAAEIVPTMRYHFRRVFE
jgi:hypothetical protein